MLLFAALLVSYIIHYSLAGNYYTITLFIKNYLLTLVSCFVCYYFIYALSILTPEKNVITYGFLAYVTVTLLVLVFLIILVALMYFLDLLQGCNFKLWFTLDGCGIGISIISILIGIIFTKTLKTLRNNEYLLVNRNIEYSFW